MRPVARFLLLVALLLATSCSSTSSCHVPCAVTNRPAEVAASESVEETKPGESQPGESQPAEDPVIETAAKRERRLVAAEHERALELARWRNPVTSWHCVMPGPPQHAHVLATDNEANIHVISYGAEDGVELGSSYVVSRGSEYIATIKISEVQAKQSAGSAIRRLSKGAIRGGDRVRRGD